MSSAEEYYLNCVQNVMSISINNLQNAKNRFSIDVIKHPVTKKLFTKLKANWIVQSNTPEELFLAIKLTGMSDENLKNDLNIDVKFNPPLKTLIRIVPTSFYLSEYDPSSTSLIVFN